MNGHQLTGLAAPVNLADLRAVARRRLDPAHDDYFAGGAGDERTVRDNEAAFDYYRVLPRVLRGVGTPDLRTTLLGDTVSMPVLVSPTAFHRLAHPDGEAGCARATAAADTIMVVSMAATTPVEAIAAAAATATPPPSSSANGTSRPASAANGTSRPASAANGTGRPPKLWFQLYPQPDLAFTESVIRRAESAGCTALVVTVDSPVFGRRERDLRHGFLDLPDGLCCENMRDPETDAIRSITMDARLDWRRIEWLRGVTRLPVVLKGILHPADAALAVEHGVDAVLVSNHGGRQLDGVPASLDALPAVVDAVAGRLPVLLDGGVRRGTDVLTALALGAVAVGVGRPVIWGLAAGGEAGVRQVLELLRADLEQAMALAGAARPAELTPDLIRPAVRR
ncbi:alpha-hydroxy acid oxidase [Solwaraspora sp. WMMD406]|uniref:alpha-hydroxy acid oxidase n=1 Tax=Solwaraspora sp. WMMD406 TaxID=3016095 RepID=UPI00241777AA|nr:alpha-hydroxy acid oxidase [Solwaraspora sp. WMMD406]MDG4763184.1 alpha-hydroxy acid oxidase [Solwaraspora sp. WMMD406]